MQSRESATDGTVTANKNKEIYLSNKRKAKNKKRNERKKRRLEEGPLYPHAAKIWAGPNNEELTLEEWRAIKMQLCEIRVIMQAKKAGKNCDELTIDELAFVQVRYCYRVN